MDSALTPNAADATAQKRARSILRDKKAIVAASWKAVLRSPDGRVVLSSILAYCGIHRSVFHPNALVMASASGRQDVGHWLEAEMESHDADALELLFRESRARRRVDRESNKAAAIERRKAKEDENQEDE